MGVAVVLGFIIFIFILVEVINVFLFVDIKVCFRFEWGRLGWLSGVLILYFFDFGVIFNSGSCSTSGFFIRFFLCISG